MLSSASSRGWPIWSERVAYFTPKGRPVCSERVALLLRNTQLGLYLCTNEAEICDFMTNNRQFLQDIFKCPKCKDGYMVVKRKGLEGFYGCTNYTEGPDGCKNTIPFEKAKK